MRRSSKALSCNANVASASLRLFNSAARKSRAIVRFRCRSGAVPPAHGGLQAGPCRGRHTQHGGPLPKAYVSRRFQSTHVAGQQGQAGIAAQRPNSRPTRNVDVNLGATSPDKTVAGKFEGPVTKPPPLSEHTPLRRRCALAVAMGVLVQRAVKRLRAPRCRLRQHNWKTLARRAKMPIAAPGKGAASACVLRELDEPRPAALDC